MTEWGLERIQRIYIDKDVLGTPVAARAKRMFPPSMITVVSSDPRPVTGGLTSSEFDRSKTEIHITKHRGRFFKRCPGARPGLQCCNYFVLNLGLQCNMNCSYCYLQSFINSPVMKIYANIDEALAELRQMAADMGDMPVRVGTGEVIDSLSLDPLTLYSRELIEFFRDYPKWRLEFKTKSSRVDQFLDVKHSGNVIVSFSVNPQDVIGHEEHGTASLMARLDAALKAKQKGFLISFHIDPMIRHDGWENSYASLVESICSRFTPADIPYLSVGGLRFQPEQRHLMRERFGGGSWVVTAETFPGTDGKYRYDQSLREEMFGHLYREFKKRSSDWNIFLCMESPETWLGAIGESPRKIHGLTELFDPAPVATARRVSGTRSDSSTKSEVPQNS